jgi:hypothetical protein
MVQARRAFSGQNSDGLAVRGLQYSDFPRSLRDSVAKRTIFAFRNNRAIQTAALARVQELQEMNNNETENWALTLFTPPGD